MDYDEGDWVLNKEPYMGSDTYIIWVAGKGQIAKIITSEANARLIAAAPIGYELAKAVLDFNPDDYDDYLKLKEIAKKFMAKAEGR